MNREISRVPPEELIKTHPISDLLEGWFFRLTEKSAGVFEAEGRNEWGRVVTHTGIDAGLQLQKCVDSAQQIVSSGEDKKVPQDSPDELLKTHPINDLLDGWFFRLTEKSAGVFEAEGRDEWGHAVKHVGIDAARLLQTCADSAQAMVSAGEGTKDD